MLAKGRTVAFLGCGLSCNYLAENASLRRAITRYGSVVSEFPPFAEPSKSSFPIRNRLISGISLGVVVIEAGVKSGSLITAQRALEQGKDVFAVPGDIVRSSFDGANHLIKNGAKPVFSALDVLNEYEFRYPDLIDFKAAALPLSEVKYVSYRKPKAKAEPSDLPARRSARAVENKENSSNSVAEKKSADELGDGISAEAKAIYSVLGEEPVHIDDIVRLTNLKMNVVLSSLTELELSGICELTGGKKYKLL